MRVAPPLLCSFFAATIACQPPEPALPMPAIEPLDADLLADADGDGFSPIDGDCDDAQPTVYPGAPLHCDGLLNDCTGDPERDERGMVTLDGTTTYGFLGHALRDASFGSELLLCPGRHQSDYFSPSDVTLRGMLAGGAEVSDIVLVAEGYRLDESTLTVEQGSTRLVDLTVEGADGTRLEGGQGPAVGGAILLLEGATLHLERVVVSGGRAIHGGGIAVLGGHLTLQDSRVEHGDAGDLGGGVYLNGGTVTLIQSTITGCEAGFGGGIAVVDGVVDSVNGALDGNFGDYGAGLFVGGTGAFAGQRLRIDENVARWDGGGAAVQGPDAVFAPTYLTFTENRAGGHGGALWVNEGAAVDFDGWTATHNHASYGGALAVGPGSRLSTIDGSLTENYADQAGGGIWADGAELLVDGTPSTGNTLTMLYIVNGAGGGGIYATGGASVRLNDVRFSRNAFYPNHLVKIEGSTLHAEDVELLDDGAASLFELTDGSTGTLVRTRAAPNLGPVLYLDHSVVTDLGGVYDGTSVTHALMTVGDGAVLTLDGTVIRNNAIAPRAYNEQPGVLVLEDGALLHMVNADLGSGTHDNHPADVGFWYTAPQQNPRRVGEPWSAGADVTTTCDGTLARCDL